MEHQPQVKRCSKCGEVKYVGEFYNDKRATDGFKCQCKKCHRLYDSGNPQGLRYDRAKAQKYCQSWRNRHPEKESEYHKRYYIPHPIVKELESVKKQKAIRRVKKWRKDNPEKARLMDNQKNKRAWQELKNHSIRSYLNASGIEGTKITQAMINSIRDRMVAIRKFKQLREELKNVSMDGNL